MAKFEITGPDGSRYEVVAPDEATALSAFQRQMGGGQAPAAPANDARYSQALDQVRATQFPDMSDQEWAQYSQTAFPPQNFNETARAAQVFGFGDEINAGLGALGSQVRQWTGGGGPGFGEAYGQYSELEQARRDLGREQIGEPAALVADVLGGGAMAGASAPAVAGAVAPGRLATAATGLGTGGLMGGLYGFGSTDGGLGERGQGAAIGGAIGGAVGAAAPYAVEAGTGIYNGVRNSLARTAAAADMGVEPAAASILRQITGADQSLGPVGQQGMNAAGVEAMLLDAGPNGQQAADYLMRKPGQAAATVGEALTNRAGRDASELQNTLNLYLGDPQGVATVRRNIATGTASERNAAYKAAYDAPIDYSSDVGRSLEDMVKNRVDQSDINAANALMRAEGIPPSRQLKANVADDGTVTYEAMPSVQQIDYITRALNDRAAEAATKGAMGGSTNAGRVYGGLANDLRGATRDAVPEYATALETAADPIRRSKATQLGYDMLGPGIPRDEAAMAIQGMTGPEKEAVALGVRGRIDENLANVNRAVTTGRPDEVSGALRAMRDLTSPANREKIALAIGDQDAALLFEEVDRIFISLQREALRRTGSQTAGRQFMDQVFDPYVNPTGIAATLGQGKPLNAGQRIIQSLTGQTPDNLAARGDEIGQQVARALVSQGPELQTNLAALTRYNAAQTNNDAVSRALAARLRPLGAPLAYQTSMQNTGSNR